MADTAEPETRRYQTRASTRTVPLKPPGASTSRSSRNHTTTAAKSVEVTLKASSKNNSASTTTTTGTVIQTAAAVRPARRAATASGAGAASRKEKETGEKVPRGTSIPVPTRTTRSGRAAAAAAISLSRTTSDEVKEQKGPSRKGGTSVGTRGGRKKAFNEDKENQGPAIEMEAELKQQEMAAADNSQSSNNNHNSLSSQPGVRKPASGTTPSKNAVRPVGSFKPKEPEAAVLFSPPKRNHHHHQHQQQPVNNPQRISPDSVDELDCPVSVGLQSQARRPNNPVRFQPQEQVNLLASPPRRNPSKHARPDRPLPAMVLTFDQPALLMQSPAKRGSGLGQSPVRGGAGAPGKLAMPPKMDLLSSPAKRPVKKLMNEADVEKEVDELSLDTYKIETSPKRPVLKKGLSFIPPLEKPKKDQQHSPMLKNETTAVPISAKTDAEGDIEMTDFDMDMEDVLSSPCPDHQSKSHQGFGLFSEDEEWGPLSPTAERGVSPLVTGLEDLSMELEGSRRSLFPKPKEHEKSVALENSAQLEIRYGNEENLVLGSIPIDPMLLEEDFTEGRGPRKISTKSGSDSNRNREQQRSNVLAGAVVYVDVHILENALASEKLVEMLHRMGAKTVQHWAWNPIGGNGGAGKIGITHVVFKDGSSTTLHKVQESNGVVMCVDVNWVVECEKQQKWIDEGLFPIDPNGIHHRRRSIDTTPNYSSPSRQFHVAVDGAPDPLMQNTLSTQPTPTDPYVNRLGFYAGGVPDQPASLMEKLMLARRKTLKYAPKIGSPLGKSCQWADY